MQQTTALRKIAALRKKIKVIQGGQGAGKTIAILILIANHASANPNKEIIIASSELTKMRLTVIKDFVKIMRSFDIYEDRRFLAGTMYRFPNGSFIKFIGLDKEDVGKGLRSDVFYLNEGNKVPFESYREIASRAGQIYIDFNPNQNFWVHEELLDRDDCDFIKLTFKDNEFLGEEERGEILRYYSKGYSDEGQIINKYWANKWRVYGLGEVGILEGAVYEDWEVIKEMPPEAKICGLGVDFGWVHPQAAIAVYEYNGKRIYDEVSYGSNQSIETMARHIKERGLERELIYCDNSAPQHIAQLVSEGVNAMPCDGKTGLINFAVEKMNRQTFYITERSENIKKELIAYVWDTDSKGKPTGKPIKIGDDAMNAIQYFEATEGKYSGNYR